MALHVMYTYLSRYPGFEQAIRTFRASPVDHHLHRRRSDRHRRIRGKTSEGKLSGVSCGPGGRKALYRRLFIKRHYKNAGTCDRTYCLFFARKKACERPDEKWIYKGPRSGNFILAFVGSVLWKIYTVIADRKFLFSGAGGYNKKDCNYVGSHDILFQLFTSILRQGSGTQAQ